jgi:hypothetical protein
MHGTGRGITLLSLTMLYFVKPRLGYLKEALSLLHTTGPKVQMVFLNG